MIEREKQGYQEVHLGPKTIQAPVEWNFERANKLFDIEKDRIKPSELDEESVFLYSMPAFDEDKEPVEINPGEIGSKKYRVPEDTLLFPKLNIRKQRFWRVKNAQDLSLCSTEYWPLLTKKDIDLTFYLYYFNSYQFMSNPKVSSSSSTNSHKRVDEDSFKRIKLPVPPLPEQRKIAEILSTVDEAIKQTEEVIETSKELKQGLMQDLLTKGIGHDEFKEVRLGPREVEVPSDWEKSQLGDLADYLNGYAFSSDNWSDQGLPIIRIQNLTGSPGEETNYYDGDDLDERYIVEPDDLLVSWSATLGVFRWDGPKAALNQHIFKVEPNEDEVNEDFLYHLLHRNVERLEQKKQGSTMQHITKSTFEGSFVVLPEKKEQRKIAEILSTVDEKIRQEEEYKQKLEELKKGLMQDLLKGKVRVNDLID